MTRCVLLTMLWRIPMIVPRCKAEPQRWHQPFPHRALASWAGFYHNPSFPRAVFCVERVRTCTLRTILQKETEPPRQPKDQIWHQSSCCLSHMVAGACEVTHPWPYDLDSPIALVSYATDPWSSWLFCNHFPHLFWISVFKWTFPVQKNFSWTQAGKYEWNQTNDGATVSVSWLVLAFSRGRERGCQMFDSKKLLKRPTWSKNLLLGHFLFWNNWSDVVII